jgi:two-component system chemotaxis response regulator CheB
MQASDPIRVLVVDDSAFNRRSISDSLNTSPEVAVVGKAANGEEALRLAASLEPDVITLDLEMPKMDGFTFLRILMSRSPLPVIVVSSYSQKENVFRALEMGALDFIAKPERARDDSLESMGRELLNKVLMVRRMRARPSIPVPSLPDSAPRKPARRVDTTEAPRRIVAIASSTGGPSALLRLFARVPADCRNAILVAQHMPDKFTRTFAERLDRRSAIRVGEAADNDRVGRQMAFLCPGRRCMKLEGNVAEGLRIRVVSAADDDRYVPSADRLFESVAQVMGPLSVGIILTGMGDDGVAGARKIIEAGGSVIAESEETAVVYGMPRSAVRAGVVSEVLGLDRIGDLLASRLAQ